MALGARRRATAARTYKLCSLLLQYPDDEQLRAGQTEIVDAIGELPRSPAATASSCGGATGPAQGPACSRTSCPVLAARISSGCVGSVRRI